MRQNWKSGRYHHWSDMGFIQRAQHVIWLARRHWVDIAGISITAAFMSAYDVPAWLAALSLEQISVLVGIVYMLNDLLKP